MLNTNRIRIGGAGMPRLVSLTHHLRHLSIRGTNHIMRRHLRIAVLKPTDATCVGAFGIMDGHRTDRTGTIAKIALGCRIPNG